MSLQFRTITKKLRRDSTGAENLFWQVVRNRQFLGLKFVRQYPIAYEFENKSRVFIADFYCHEAKLVIEIDGPIHDFQEEKDEIKDLVLKEKGLTIYRYKNREIEHELATVLNALQCRLLSLPS